MIEEIAEKFIELVKQNSDKLESEESVRNFISRVMPSFEAQVQQSVKSRPEYQGFQ